MALPLLRFEEVRAPRLGLHGLDLALPCAACSVLLGPPEAGAAGALRLLAGLASPEAGRVLLDGADGGGAPAGWRGVGLFRVEALPPSRSVEQVATELLRHLAPRERATQLARALTWLGLDGQEATRLSHLPPAQQRRVALARALAPQPSVLLLEEPLEGLDQAVRHRLALELRGLVRRLGMTLVVALRDGAEAMLLADHLAVLEAGRLAQQGIPQAVYEAPASALVAGLVGENNRLPGTVLALDGEECRVRLDCGPELWARRGDAAGPGSRCILAVRPERVAVAALAAEEMGEGALPAALRDLVFLGDHLRLQLEVGRGGLLVAKRPPGSRVPRPGGPAAVAWDPDAAIAFRALR